MAIPGKAEVVSGCLNSEIGIVREQKCEALTVE